MKKFLSLLQSSPLFRQVQPTELEALLNCLQAQEATFRKEEYIWHTGQSVSSLGIVLEGSVLVLKEDFQGNRTILTQVEPGELFGESFCCAQTDNLPVSVIAAQDCRVLWLDYLRIITTCSAACQFHSRLIENMLLVLARKNLMLNQKIEHLAKRSTREKLLSYLSAQAQSAGGPEFVIPYNRQQLADYLCVERSAMSSELSKLRAEGLLEFERNRFKLLVH